MFGCVIATCHFEYSRIYFSLDVCNTTQPLTMNLFESVSCYNKLIHSTCTNLSRFSCLVQNFWTWHLVQSWCPLRLMCLRYLRFSIDQTIIEHERINKKRTVHYCQKSTEKVRARKWTISFPCQQMLTNSSISYCWYNSQLFNTILCWFCPPHTSTCPVLTSSVKVWSARSVDILAKVVNVRLIGF